MSYKKREKQMMTEDEQIAKINRRLDREFVSDLHKEINKQQKVSDLSSIDLVAFLNEDAEDSQITMDSPIVIDYHDSGREKDAVVLDLFSEPLHNPGIENLISQYSLKQFYSADKLRQKRLELPIYLGQDEYQNIYSNKQPFYAGTIPNSALFLQKGDYLIFNHNHYTNAIKNGRVDHILTYTHFMVRQIAYAQRKTEYGTNLWIASLEQVPLKNAIKAVVSYAKENKLTSDQLYVDATSDVKIPLIKK